MILMMTTMLMMSLAHADEGHGGAVIQPKSGSHVHSATTNFQFRIFDPESGKHLSESDLVISHERILHFLAYDQALKEFQHVHPTFDGEYWSVTLNFAVSGKYKIWAQGTTGSGVEFSAPGELNVMVKNPAWPLPPELGDVRTASDAGSVATLSSTELKAGEMVMLDLDLSREDGSNPEITPYLGAVAHVIAVSENGEELAHVHPMDGEGEVEGMLHVTFPKPGFYRIWVEFMDAGTLREVALAVRVL